MLEGDPVSDGSLLDGGDPDFATAGWAVITMQAGKLRSAVFGSFPLLLMKGELLLNHSTVENLN